MKFSLYTPVYTVTLLLSAALLFSVQPLFSKMILPLLGGTPQVWNTAMLFFQVMLLGGYAYAHVSSKFLGIKAQALLHITLLIIFVFVLPLAIPEGGLPRADQSPILWQLTLMLTTIGGPFFVVSASAPMLQHWFARTDHPDAHNPYFLYGASNLGSLSALLAYPVLIEPLLSIPMQSQSWAGGYILLITLTALAAFLVWRTKGGDLSSDKQAISSSAQDDTPVTWRQRLLWLALAAIPSSLMLGVTTYITTDVASVPLLWILPLALYVGTFVIVFARKQIISLKMVALLQGISILLLIALLINGSLLFSQNAFFSEKKVFIIIGFQLWFFFITALTCHMELAKSRPNASHLTEFYMFMSLGGVIGGFFNAIIAPLFFIIPLEYVMAIIAALFFRYSSQSELSLSRTYKTTLEQIKSKGLDFLFMPHVMLGILVLLLAGFSYVNTGNPVLDFAFTLAMLVPLAYFLRKRWSFAILASVILLFFPPGYKRSASDHVKILHQDRNFFGIVKVMENKEERFLVHGTTNHGSQALASEHKMEQLSYYAKASPIGEAFSILEQRDGPQNIAIIGLGVGVTACYQKEARHFDFFEIDKNVIEIAQNPELFTFLTDCGSPYDIIIGDGRLKIDEQPDKKYDMIVLDAFSSDNIPVHIITLEAIEIYLKKLKDDGALVFNISNNYIDLEPVLTEAAKVLNVKSYASLSVGGKTKVSNLQYYAAHFAVLSKDEAFIESLKDKGWTPTDTRKNVKIWRDDYSNILHVLQNKSGTRRHIEKIKAQRKEEEDNEEANEIQESEQEPKKEEEQGQN